MSYEDIEELAFKDSSEMLEQNKLVLLDIIDILQYDRKQWINQYTQAHNDYVLLQQENQQLEQALLDIKEYIETNSYFKDNIVKTMVLGDYSKGILDIVNKALGSDSDE